MNRINHPEWMQQPNCIGEDHGCLRKAALNFSWASPLESIDFSKPRYDQSTYWGRLLHFSDVTDPRTMFVTSKQLEDSQRLLDSVKTRAAGWDKHDAEEVWRAKKLVSSAIGANGVIPLPLRFSAFVPMNMITLLCMLHPSMQSPGRAMFWQWWNQTYNSGVNYANRGNAGPVDMTSLATSYLLAVSISCGVSLAGGKILQKLGDRLAVLRLFLPYIAVASASVANVVMVRQSDFRQGVTVFDKETGEDLGTSKIAGRTAVSQVAVSRLLVPLPLLTLPPVIVPAIMKSFFKGKPASWEVTVNLTVIAMLLLVVTPACIAVYPQETIMNASDLEPEFQGRKNRNGNAVAQVRFDKGL
jgi:tricarboxylate carrier